MSTLSRASGSGSSSRCSTLTPAALTPVFLVSLGATVIWDALKVAVNADDVQSAKLILEAADVIVAEPDLSVCYDQKGRKYELPVYVLSEPINLVSDEE